jgi:hypothetical protein
MGPRATIKRASRLVALALGLVLAVPAVTAPARYRFDFVTASPGLKRACADTAKFVGYAVPCPLQVPRGLFAESGGAGCATGVVFAPFRSVATCEGARGWRGWVAGAGATPGGMYVVLTAAPRVMPNIAKVVNGPAWYPNARVQLLGRSRVRGWLVRWAFVPAATNDGSQFSDAVVAAWSAGGHTYAIGCRAAAGGRAVARALAVRLLEGLSLAGPRG